MPWQFWIDRGGTFTDCLALAPDGALHTAKLLSSETAPGEAIRRVLERVGAIGPGGALPACRVKLGTTVATNALLERRGVPTALVANAGLADVVEIGTQERPALFELAIRKPAPLHARTLEVTARVGADGARIAPLDEPALRRSLGEARAAGVRSVAIALAHAYAWPDDEARVAALAREAGFEHVVTSAEVARELGLLARAETTSVDAYLTPLLRRHVAALEAELPGAQLRFMQSSGGLAPGERFRGPTALLSGPAGGVVGASQVAAAGGFQRAVGFDMGGTSTDVSLLEPGALPRSFETLVGGVRVRAPMLRIHTVAAGGGSLCRYDGIRMTVGPESAGADPGPLCYGHPQARDLAITDVNLWLGRVQPDRFPFPLETAPVGEALSHVGRALAEAGHARDPDAIAAGFVEVANASMAEAIRRVSVERGVDPRTCALVGFGGAGGQHVCAIARELGMRDVLLHPFAGVLSAWGIGVADTSWDGQRDAGRVSLPPAPEPLPEPVREAFRVLEDEGRAALAAEGLAPERVRIERVLDLRTAGTETALPVPEPEAGDWGAAFARAHAARFGYTREGRAVEIVTARVRASARAEASPAPALPPGDGTPPQPLREARVWFPATGRRAAPVYAREDLRPGTRIEGPALVLEDTATVVLDPGFALSVRHDGVLHLVDEGAPAPAQAGGAVVHASPAPPEADAAGGAPAPGADWTPADPVRLEVFGHRFMSIAEQMGAVLRNTAVSTNIKERLDYSCAVFDAEAGLVANAPHIPVHLGAMSETVQAVRERFPDLAPGDVVATNDPFAGGSHLPDVTVVTPVFVPAEPGRAAPYPRPDFFVASRGHHADIGGITPGSMPADSRRLEDEGVLIEPLRVVRGGRFDEAALRDVLTRAAHPARRPDDNVADLEAMVAANRAGAGLLEALVAEQGVEGVQRTMRELQTAAAAKVRREIARLADGEHAFRDALDDGTPVAVALRVSGERMVVDFTGTGPAVPGNLNAPRAVVHAAVIYVLRCLVAERIPLNGGCLEPVEIRIPPGSLLDPPPGSAVVGGNVETSQRIVDVLLGAIGRVAASQGTMNNVAFGSADFGYYETIGGGAGAGEGFAGASGVHTHMTNTRITDLEVLETRHPVRLEAFRIRRGSGGAGRWRGGDGLERVYRFLAPVTVSLLTQRRERAPFGLRGGADGARGANTRVHRDGRREPLPHRVTLDLDGGEGLVVETPGGGGFGAPAH